MNLGSMATVQKTQLLHLVEGRAWAILPSVLEGIQRALISTTSDLVSLASVKAALPADIAEGSSKRPYRVEDGKAIVQIVGPLEKRMSFMQWLYGGESTENIIGNIEAALADKSVDSIVLNIDSPGGSVDGTKELADYIYEARGKKHITAYVDGNALSAAYWIASAADRIIAPDTARVGSIGVYMAHMDASKFYEAYGVKKTYIYAGKYKVVGNEAGPLSESDKEYLQASVDKFYSLFVGDVARNRGVSTKKVISDMAEGRIFIGKDALEAGLIDKIGGFRSSLMKRGPKGSSRADGDLVVSVAAQDLTPGSATAVIAAVSSADNKVSAQDTLDKKILSTVWGQAHGAKTGKDFSASLKSHLKTRREALSMNAEWDEQEWIAESKELYGATFEATYKNWHFVRKTTSVINKEEKIMDLQELKASYPDYVQAIKTEAVDSFKASSEYVSLHASAAALTTKVAGLEASNRENEKRAALAEEKFLGVAAEREQDRILSASSLPDRLFGKVKKQVDYRGFVKDGDKFEANSDSFKAFSAAFEAEVKDWEKDVSGTGVVVGQGAAKDAVSGDAQVAYAQGVAREISGRIKSDRK